MKKLLQKFIISALIMCMALSLVSCGKAKGVSVDPMLAKQNVFRGVDITFEDLKEGDYYVQTMGATEDTVYTCIVEYTYVMNEELGYEEGRSDYKVYSFDFAGNFKDSYQLALEDSQNAY